MWHVKRRLISRTFAIENNVRRLPENIDSVHDILASRADGESDVEWHGGRGMYKTVVKRRGREGMGG